ncbi:MAG: restriction endonuclease subunit S [Clostridia bacterium]|nr:restriction endonuclease subunit S [Clostridia bacterium]
MVKPGYKQTEIGVIPEDWEEKKLGELAKVCMCKRIFADQTVENGEIPFFKIGTFGKEADAYISRSLYEDFKQRFSYPQKGDVLISAAGTLGRSVIFDGKDAYFQDSNIVWLDTDKARLCNEYLYHYYKVIQWASSEGSTIARLYNGIICNTHIALPKVEEQKRIAAVLSEMDRLILTLEKQISKKKAIKQGAMQELLTGKRRLPGFEGAWKTKKLGEYCSLVTKQTGFDYSAYIKPVLITQKMPNTLPMIQTINFRGRKFSFDTDYYIPKTVALQFPNIVLNEKCVLFSIVGASVGNVGLYPGGTTAFCGGAIGITRFHDEQDAAWIYYYMSSPDGQAQIHYVTKGGAQATVTIADIRNFKIPTPEKDERDAISSVLENMDHEIEVLEEKLAKYRQVKQGMMQQLLTGKVRLV